MPGLRSLRGRIILAFSPLMLLVVGAIVASVLVIQSGPRQPDALERAALTAMALDDIEVEFSLETEAVRGYVASQDDHFAATFQSSVARVKEDIGDARAQQVAAGDGGHVVALDNLAKHVQQIELQGEGLFLLVATGDPERAKTAQSEIDSAIDSSNSALAQLITDEQQQLDSVRPSTTRTMDVLFWALVGLTGAASLAGGLAAVKLRRSVLRPLASLQASARSIASGSFEETVQVSGPAELESLARDFNRATVALLARQTTEIRAAEADTRFRQLAEASADLVFRVDIQKGVTYANAAWERIMGFAPEELCSGAEIAGRIVHPDQWQSFVTLWKEMLSGNLPEGPLPMKWMRKDGGAIWLVVSFVPVHDADGRLMAIEGMARDVTPLRHLIKEVQRRDEQLGQFLDLSKTLSTSIGFDETAERALNGVLRVLPRAEAGLLLAYNPKRNLLQVRAVQGLERKIVSKVVAKPGEGLMGNVFESGVARVYSSPEEVEAAGGLSPQGKGSFEEATKETGLPQSIMCVPLGVDSRTLGCLVAITFSEGACFQSADLELLQAAANQVTAPLENAQLRAETELRAITDGLTGLYNHAYFHQRLSEEIERSKRYGYDFAVVITDIDNFKSYNDERGHPAGDKVLCLAGDSIQSQMRRSDVACRYSGDEFAAILMQADLRRAQTAVERIETVFAAKLQELNDPATACLSLSAGIAYYPDDGLTVDELAKVAELSLRSAKLASPRVTQTA
ncbi:MAG: diguanylate cyclase [Chloroflexota bacterium]|nr:diguanylate cyclase [Chloroflexota bacterium]